MARYYTGEPDARDDAYEHDGHEHLMAAQRYENAIHGMCKAIRDAADPGYPVWSSYRGDIIGLAVWWTKHVARLALAQGRLGVSDDADGETPRGEEAAAQFRDQQVDAMRLK